MEDKKQLFLISLKFRGKLFLGLAQLSKILLDLFLVSKNKTRQNVTGFIKRVINSSLKVAVDILVIGILEYLQSDKKIKTLTDTAELVEDAVYAVAV